MNTNDIDEMILSFLEEHHEYDYNVAPIFRGVDASYQTVRSHIKKLNKEGKIKITKRIGNCNMYQIKNWNSP